VAARGNDDREAEEDQERAPAAAGLLGLC